MSNNGESNNDDPKLRELERELESVLDEDSIAEMLDGYAPREQAESEENNDKQTLELDSEALIGTAPSSEAHADPPTVEAYVGEAPDDHMPEAAVVMRRTRKDAKKYPAQPPPLPGGLTGSNTGRHRAPSKPPKPPQAPPPTRSEKTSVDLRPTDRLAEKRWELDRTPLASVLLELVTRPGLSLLEVRVGRRSAQLVVEDGRIFEVRLLPTLAKRSLTAFLQRGGKLSADKAADFRRRARRKGICEAQALLEEPEIISPSVVRSAVCSRTRYLLRRLLSAKLSSAELYALDDASMASMIVSVPLVGVLFSHVRADHSAKSSGRRARARRGFQGMKLCRKPSFAFSVNQLGLKLHERQLIDRVLTRPRSFAKVLKNSPLPEDDTIALLTALEAVGLLQVKAPGLCEVTSSTWAEDYAATLERIELMETRLERENLFAIFGLHWTSHDAHIEQSYREMSQVFEAANQPLGLSKDERERVRRVRETLDAMHKRLSDAERRELYRRKLIGGRTRSKAAKKLEALGSAAVRRRALHSALDYYQRLLEIEPNHDGARRLLPVLIARTTR